MTYSLDRLEQLDAQFRAANYLGAAQLYLRDNIEGDEPAPVHRELWQALDPVIAVRRWRWTDPASVAPGSAGGE